MYELAKSEQFSLPFHSIVCTHIIPSIHLSLLQLGRKPPTGDLGQNSNKFMDPENLNLIFKDRT